MNILQRFRGGRGYPFFTYTKKKTEPGKMPFSRNPTPQPPRQITGGVAELPAMDASSHACAECYLELSKYLKIPMTMTLMWSRMKERGTNKMVKKKFRRPPSWQVFPHPAQKRSQLRNASKAVSSCRYRGKGHAAFRPEPAVPSPCHTIAKRDHLGLKWFSGVL